jgi:uncharacterized protein
MTADELADLITRGDSAGVSRALREDPALISARTAEGDTPLHIVAWQKQVGMLGALDAYEPDVNAIGAYGRTPLHYAVHEGGAVSVPIVSHLMARGADPSIRDENGFSVADWAKIEMDDGLEKVLELLGPKG